MAASRLVRGTLFGFDLAAGDCALQGAFARRRRPDAELDETIASTVADPTDDPEVVLQKKDRSERLRHSLERLSPEHGEVIDLVYYHGKSVKDAAEIIGISEATAKTRMFYARRKLADLVAPA